MFSRSFHPVEKMRYRNQEGTVRQQRQLAAQVYQDDTPGQKETSQTADPKPLVHSENEAALWKQKGGLWGWWRMKKTQRHQVCGEDGRQKVLLRSRASFGSSRVPRLTFFGARYRQIWTQSPPPSENGKQEGDDFKGQSVPHTVWTN